MNASASAPCIGVFGHYGNSNLGDEATIAAVVDNIRSRLPGAEIVGLCINPRDGAVRHGIDCFPIRRGAEPARAGEDRADSAVVTTADSGPGPAGSASAAPGALHRLKERMKSSARGARAVATLGRAVRAGPEILEELKFLWRNARLVRRLDLLMICGSNQFLDRFGGTGGYPYTLFKWSLLARLCGTRVVYLSVGAGPIARRSSYRLLRWALRVADYVSFRDQASYEMLADHGYRGPPLVFPDLAFSLPVRARSPRPDAAPLRVGINPMPVYDARYWYVVDETRYRTYVNELVRFIGGVRSRGHELVLWPTMPRDVNVINDILAALGEHGAGVMAEFPDSVESLRDVIDSLDITVATRFHGVVLSLAAGTPCIAICYHRKHDDLMRDTAQADYSLRFDEATAEELLKRLDTLAGERGHHADVLELRIRGYREALARQYDELLASLGGAMALPDALE